MINFVGSLNVRAGGGGTSSASQSASNAAGGAGGGVDPDELIALWFDYALLIVLAFFFLASLPRLVPRLARFSTLTSGFFLRKGSVRVLHPPVTDTDLHRRATNVTFVDDSSDQAHTLAAHSYAESSKNGRFFPEGAMNAPAHIRSYSSLLYPLSAFFAFNVAPGKSIEDVLLAVAYVVGIIVAVFINGGDPFTKPVRMGWLAISQIPVVVALGTKNNLIGMLVGKGYERLNRLHQLVGASLVVCANVHAIGYIAQWQNAGITATMLAQPQYQAAIAAVIGFNVVSITSKPLFRKKAYPFFLASHIIGITVAFVAVCYHKAPAVSRVVIALIIYGLDHVMRLAKTRVCTAQLRTLSELQSTRIELPSLGAGWRAGQHVRLRILSPELGFLGCTFAHPFTIANAPGGPDGGGLQLIVKKAGLWTNKLYDAAGRAREYSGDDVFSGTREMRVVVEGPYGGLGNAVLTSYSAAVLVAGGSGITFPLAAVEEIVRAICEGKSSIRYIELVWSTEDIDNVNPLLPTFSALLTALDSAPGVVLKVSVFYTRAPTKPSPADPLLSSEEKLAFSNSSSNSKTVLNSGAAYRATLADRVSVRAGRPPLASIVENAARFVGHLPRGDARGVAVGACGPGGLVADAAAAARKVPADVRSACGSVEVHGEFFEW